jgi:hypothetical protein
MDNASERIRHLMALYYWSWQEAMEYYYYEPYDPVDWENF